MSEKKLERIATALEELVEIGQMLLVHSIEQEETLEEMTAAKLGEFGIEE